MVRKTLTLIALLVCGMSLVVSAQEDQPLTQPTIDAAVNQILQQTDSAAQAQATQSAATQTIQAALEGAVTATAQAATPAPINAADLALEAATEIDLLAGPVATSAFLAPNGEYFAYWSRDTICLYTGAVERQCTDLSEQVRAVYSESIRWSPDSRYLVFTEDFFRRLDDPDIWVWDTVENTVTDLTDDGQTRLDFDAEEWENLDVLPTWLDDGRILFLRYTRRSGSEAPPLPEIYVINPDGTGEEKLGELSVGVEALPVTSLDVGGNHLAYNHYSPSDSPLHGIWTSDLDGANPRQVLQSSNELIASSVDISPNGSYVLFTIVPSFESRFVPEDSLTRAVDTTTGELILIDQERYVNGAGWSPDGSALIYSVNSRLDEAQNGLYTSAAPGTPGRLLLAGGFFPATSLQQQFYIWGSNNTILLSRLPATGIVLAHLE